MILYMSYYVFVTSVYWVTLFFASEISIEEGFYVFLIFMLGAYGVFPVIFGKNMSPPYSSVILIPKKDRFLRGFFALFFSFVLFFSYFFMVGY